MRRTQIRNLFYLIFALGVIAYVAYLKMSDEQSKTRFDSLKFAPEWKLEDLEGNDVHSDLLAGNVTLVNFWATWCTICRAEIPYLIKYQQKYGSEGFKVIGISMDDAIDSDKIAAFVDAQDMNYLVLRSTAKVVEDFGNIEGVPTSFLIDRDGKVISAYQGPMPKEEVGKLIEDAL